MTNICIQFSISMKLVHVWPMKKTEMESEIVIFQYKKRINKFVVDFYSDRYSIYCQIWWHFMTGYSEHLIRR